MSAELLVLALLALAALWLLLSWRDRGQRVSIQTAQLGIGSIADEVVTFTDGRRCAVLEVGSVNFSSLGEAQQREIIAGYSAVVGSLTFGVQTLVRATPLDLTPYLEGREARAQREPHERLRRVARDRNALVRRLAGSRTFLDRRFYLVIPADNPRPAATLRLPRLPGAGRGDEPPAAAAAAAARQLTARCDDLARQLGRCGLTARRLDDGELAALNYACWCPDLARVQRLRRDLHDYQSLVVTRAATDSPAERSAS